MIAPSVLGSRQPADEELVTAVCQGHRERFGILVNRYAGLIRSYLGRSGASPGSIEDLTQETFLKAFRGLSGYDPNRRFATWILTIARNILTDEWKRASRQRRQTAPNPLDFRSPPNPADVAVDKLEIENILARLPEGDRLLLELRCFQEIPFKDLADLLETTEPALRMRFHRLLRSMRTCGKEVEA